MSLAILETLRDALADPPSERVADAVGDAIQRLGSAADRRIALDYVSTHIAHWPEFARVRLASWCAELFYDQEAFWASIEQARTSTDGSPFAMAEWLEDELAAMDSPSIVAFEGYNRAYQRLASRHDLWCAVSAARGGCSDDTFDYFCGWLVCQGRARYNTIVADPEALAAMDWPDGPWSLTGISEGEWMLGVGRRAYQRRCDETMDYPHGSPTLTEASELPPERLSDNWSEVDAFELFPALARRFWPRDHISRAAIKSQERARERKQAARGASLYEQLVVQSSQAPTPYRLDQTFAKGELISHARFGVGAVVKVQGNKINVVFESAMRELVHGRGARA